MNHTPKLTIEELNQLVQERLKGLHFTDSSSSFRAVSKEMTDEEYQEFVKKNVKLLDEA